MRIKSIGLKNFGSYQDAEIDLANVSAAVVTGQNGSGKSTGFVDAPLAALFGKCRVSLDDIMQLGADDMVLTICFDLNGQSYRVIRKRSKKTRAGRSELALQVANGPGWEDASGARIQDTQAKICQLLNADYDLLTATGFLLQGQADRFSRATPTERKAILAQILRLDQYGPLKQAANRHAAIAETKASERAMQVRTLTAAAETVPSLEVRQGELTTALAQSQQAIVQLEAHQQELTTKKATLAAELGQLESLPAQIASVTASRAELVTVQQAKLTRRDRAAKILANRETIEAKVQEEEQAKQLEGVLEQERAWLVHDLLEANQQLADITKKVAELAVLERDLTIAKAATVSALQTYRAETDRLGADIARDEEACRLLKQVPCDSELQGRCQFTLQAVAVEQALPAKRQLFGERYCTPGSEEKIAPEQVATVNRLAEQCAALSAEGHTARVHQVAEHRTTLIAKQQDCERRRQACRDDIARLAQFTALVPELAAADLELSMLDEDIRRDLTELNKLESDLAQLTSRQAARAQLIAESQDVSSSFEQDGIYLAKLRTESLLAIGRLKELELELKQAQEAARQVLDLQHELAQCQRDQQHFQVLATAYTQIPVLILETAIPLLEEEANRILGQISPSGMRVRLDTQKALKSRDGLAETLNIVVRDVFGERAYENYSGGEKFRLDLALRIGLSKLLANRAGAKLETLIIDEGLGSLDDDGLAQLRDCLATLQQEFPLVLVVTHVEAMKHTFPSQLVVSKDAAGSHVELVA